MSMLVKIVDSRLEYSSETFSFRKQYNYTNVFVNSYEGCLSKGRVLQRFWFFRKQFLFFFAGSQQDVKKSQSISAFLGNDKER